jgi:hypothetical protein
MSVESRGQGVASEPHSRRLHDDFCAIRVPVRMVPSRFVIYYLAVIWLFPLPQAQRPLAVKANLSSGPAEPSRVAILEALRAGPLTVGELAQRTGLSSAERFESLAGLADWQLVEREPEGPPRPQLANVGARSYIAAGTPGTPRRTSPTRSLLEDVKHGLLMPYLAGTQEESKALVACLRTHR